MTAAAGWVGRSIRPPLPVSGRRAIRQPPASCQGVLWLEVLQSFTAAPTAQSGQLAQRLAAAAN